MLNASFTKVLNLREHYITVENNTCSHEKK